MLLIFRLNKLTSSSTTYTLAKEIRFNKMTFRGFTWEHCDNLAGDTNGFAPSANSELPVYLSMDCFGDNDIVFHQGENTTITNAFGEIGIGNWIPLGGVKEHNRNDMRKFDLKLIDRPVIWEVGKQITIALYQIQSNGFPDLLTDSQAFGGVNSDNGGEAVEEGVDPVTYDHGVNLYFEVDCDRSQDFTQVYTIPDAQS
tara:strand:+ start:2385 stop:2981 length:597 start_codon:yes stop_codon:yes gene_type:complete